MLACLVDFSKAFNRQDNSILVTKLSDMGVPGWLLRLVVAFLKERTMAVRYKGKISGVKQLPGGGPQGTLLGLLLFLVLINDLGWDNQSNNIGEIITCRRRLKQVNEIHLKYVDDLALAEAIDMKSQLKTVPVAERPQPDVFRARTGHALINEDSTLIARRLAPCRSVICASPNYLAKHSAPQSPEDLIKHNCINYAYFSGGSEWTFHGESGPLKVKVAGNYQVNNSEALHQATLSGLGIAKIPTFIVGEDINQGKLVPLLREYSLSMQNFYAVFPERRHLPAKVRVFIDKKYLN